MIGGFTDREGSSSEVGSLLLGYYDEPATCKHAGNVGTGWDAATAADLHERLAQLETASPLSRPAASSRAAGRGAAPGQERWVKPELVAEVSFADWTPDGRIRHAVFQGLRERQAGAARSRAKRPVAAGADAAAAPPARVSAR